MDELADFFTSTKQFEKISISGGTTNGRTVSIEKPKPSQRCGDFDNKRNYAEKYIQENQSQLLKSFNTDATSSSALISDSDDDPDEDSIDSVYLHYDFNQREINQNLPISVYKSRILRAIKENPILILQGATGCGKTTQVPQYILDDAFSKQKCCNIVVTQPRRIAAIFNAERVAKERKWPLRSVVGYQIGLDERSNFSDDTRILFCTTGILLEKLIKKKDFCNFTHIILDEVHERNKDMDFLFIIIRKLLATILPRPKIKIILMSATIDTHAFSKYFEMPNNGALVPAPIIQIDQKSKFTISEFFFEEFSQILPNLRNIKFTFEEPGIHDEMYTMALHLINKFCEIDAREKFMSVEDINDVRPTILIFLPGINEINKMYNILTRKWSDINLYTKLLCVILHSTSSMQQRAMVMQRPGGNLRKVILATNIAESSITVPDVKYVIDYCLTRALITDRTTNFTSLQLNWAARSNCKQRAGRTGRVMNGRCYRFVTKYFYNNIMAETATPELITSPLENIVLKAKILDMGPPKAILGLAMDKPKLSDIANTILILKEVGALLRTLDGVVTDLDGDISFIGRIMANLPIDIKIAKFIILGYCFSIFDECLIIGAALNCTKSLFRPSSNARDGMKSYSHLLQWANGSGSDLIAMLHAYKVWSQLHNQKKFGTTDTKENQQKMIRSELEWADKFGIELAALYECQQQIKELEIRLERLKITEPTGVNKVRWSNSEKSIILKVVIAGAFYPNLFGRSIPDRENFGRETFRCTGGRDPRNTVYFTGFPRENIRSLYIKSIKEIFIKNGIVRADDEHNLQVAFENGANKVYVTFKNVNKENNQREYGVECMPGKIQTEVYKSIKMRTLQIPSKIRIIKSNAIALKYAEECGLQTPIDGKHNTECSIPNFDQICVPRILDKNIIGYIRHIQSCSRFWFQPRKQAAEVNDFNKFLQLHKKSLVKRISEINKISVGQIVVIEVQTLDDYKQNYYRAKVLSIDDKVSIADSTVQVYLIDFGDTIKCKFTKLCDPNEIPKKFMDLPPRCFECCLAEVQPSRINYPDGIWPNAAVNVLKDLTNDQEVNAEIFSIANGVTNVFIHLTASLVDINELLIQQGYAEFSEEDYCSKESHYLRQDRQRLCDTIDLKENFFESSYIDFVSDNSSIEVEPPPSQMCSKEINLKGPLSPLEIKICSVTEIGKNRSVIIDRQSVNSVILENNPEDFTEKYMVAASVCDTSNKNNLSVRQTTLMPNIRGFGPLMALIFCPTMEIKRDKSKSRYIAIRTGLGYDEVKQRPIFEEHDIVFNLDVEIFLEDIEEINQIRYCLDSLLHTHPDQEIAENISTATKAELTSKIKELLVRLLGKPRKLIGIHREEHLWNTYDPCDVIVSHSEDIYGERAIFPLHNALKLYTEKSNNLSEQMQKHCQELHLLAEITSVIRRNFYCKLCLEALENLPQLKIHLVSRLHRDRESDIGFIP